MTRAGAANAEACLDGCIRARTGYAGFSWVAAVLAAKIQRPWLPSAVWVGVAFAVLATVAMTLSAPAARTGPRPSRRRARGRHAGNPFCRAAQLGAGGSPTGVARGNFSPRPRCRPGRASRRSNPDRPLRQANRRRPADGRPGSDREQSEKRSSNRRRRRGRTLCSDKAAAGDGRQDSLRLAGRPAPGGVAARRAGDRHPARLDDRAHRRSRHAPRLGTAKQAQARPRGTGSARAHRSCARSRSMRVVDLGFATRTHRVVGLDVRRARALGAPERLDGRGSASVDASGGPGPGDDRAARRSAARRKH